MEFVAGCKYLSWMGESDDERFVSYLLNLSAFDVTMF